MEILRYQPNSQSDELVNDSTEYMTLYKGAIIINTKEFKNLTVWHKSMEILKEVANLAEYIEKKEQKDKVLRTAYSIPIAIARGNGQLNKEVELYQINEAVSKSKTLINVLDEAKETGDITDKQYKKLEKEIKTLRVTLFALRNMKTGIQRKTKEKGRKLYGRSKK